MKILVLTHFFPPEPCAASNRTMAVCAGLRQAGHEVRVLTGFPNFPTGIVPDEYRRRLFSREIVEGLPVLRVWTYASPRLNARARVLNWASVAAAATLAAPAYAGDVDAVYVTCPPITLALPALTMAAIFGKRLIVDVRDAYPDVAVKMGVWKSDAPITKLVGRVASALYRRADAIACVTASVRSQVLERDASPGKTFIAPNGYDIVEPAPTAPYRRTAEEFVVAFAGNIGVAAGAEIVLDAAARLRPDSNVKFVLAGASSAFEAVQDRARREKLDNVTLLGAVERRKALALLRDADISVVPLRKGIRDSLPTKIFDSLYVACPVLLSGEGEAEAFLLRSGAGWSVPPEDADALARAIRARAANRAECRKAGVRGGDYVRFAGWDRSDGIARIVRATAGS